MMLASVPSPVIVSDVETTINVLDELDGPAILVGYSYSAWRSKPSWYLIATDDRMIPPPAQRSMSERAGSTVVEAPGSHSIYVSQPGAVASLVTQAARSVSVAPVA